MTKIEKIYRFLEKHKNLPAQRTKEWYQARIGRFGGSELHNIVNLKHSNINTFVNNFLYYKIANRGNPFIFPCVFGNIFENEIKNLTEYNFKTKIYETGSIPYDKLKSVSYSPDGLGIVDDKIVLFEFKCPISREINKNKIKFEYLMQVNSGLHVLEEVIDEKALYIEAEFKKCTLNDLLNNNTFDKIFHNKFLNRDFSELYKHFGMILIYETGSEIYHGFEYPDVIDYGDATFVEMETLFFNIHKKKFNCMYLSDVVNDLIEAGNKDEILSKFIKVEQKTESFSLQELEYLKNILIEACVKDREGIPLYLLPWKCFNYNIIEVKKNNEFFSSELKEKCIYFAHIVKYIVHLNEKKNMNENEIKELLMKYTKEYLKE